MWSIFLVFVRTLATAFWISCSCLIDFYFIFFNRTCQDQITVMESTENKSMNKFFCVVEKEQLSFELRFSGGNLENSGLATHYVNHLEKQPFQ